MLPSPPLSSSLFPLRPPQHSTRGGGGGRIKRGLIASCLASFSAKMVVTREGGLFSPSFLSTPPHIHREGFFSLFTMEYVHKGEGSSCGAANGRMNSSYWLRKKGLQEEEREEEVHYRRANVPFIPLLSPPPKRERREQQRRVES